MPHSLWLIPHAGNPFTKAMQELITDTVPRQFSQKAHNTFQPHVTLTSDVDKSAQEWLDSLPLPDFKAHQDEVILELDKVEAEDPFFRKMNISITDNANLKTLAALARQHGVAGTSEDDAKTWSQKEYRPHLSLLYADIPTQEVQAKVPLIEMKIGFAIGDIFACCGGTLCMGGFLVLVDTSKAVEEWEVVAKREVPWIMWRATHNLI